MCGITGKISRAREEKFADVSRALRALHHRGPDGEGIFKDSRVCLAMRRLAIIDVAGGDQPLFNEDKSVAIIGNGEIYNYVELQKSLIKKGHRLRTGSDIETAAHAYEEYGLHFVNHLRGIFALALYDKKRQKVILCRDRFGEKPLYYSKSNDGIIFSSELKSLLAALKKTPSLDPTAVSEFFHFNYVPEPSTIFGSIKKLQAGHLLEIDVSTLATIDYQYWDMLHLPWKKTPHLLENIKETFEWACEITNRADVPVGLALSGGIDSSAIIATLAKKHRDTLTAFSIGYEHEPASDERARAREFAAQFEIPFFTAEIKDSDVIADFPQTIWAGDDPIMELGRHNLNEIYKLTHQHHIKVLLSGVGGDELFWGYPWFTDVVNKNLRLFDEQKHLDQLIFEDARPKVIKAKQFTTHFFTTLFADSVDSSRLTDQLDASQLHNKRDIVRKLQYLLQSRWLVSHVNALNDRLSMSNSVELRTPFLDYKLAQLAYSSTQLQRGYARPNKYWFKKALADRLPTSLTRRGKQGFTPPTKRWLFKLLNEYMRLLNGGFLVESQIISATKVAALAKGWWLAPLYWDEMYKMITLETWGREFVWGQKPSELTR